MTVDCIHPLTDARWKPFVERQPRASAFHTTEWLEALRHTYGFEPLAVAVVTPEGEIRSAILYSAIESWLTGRRMVSLPFTDHCEPLVESEGDFQLLCEQLCRTCDENHYGYVELRPFTMSPPDDSGFAEGGRFYMHSLNLRLSLEEIFAALNKDSTQRKIRRAEREGLTYRRGNSEELLHYFFPLLVRTRRRHGVPPQPLEWFRNLLACMEDAAVIRVALKDEQPIAATLTLSFRDTVIYKYGCSDESHHPLGGMALVFWRMIQEAQMEKAVAVDLGRTDLDNPGLATFKEHWGAIRSPLTYWRYPAKAAGMPRSGWKAKLGTKLFSAMPETLLVASGRILYRHFA